MNNNTIVTSQRERELSIRAIVIGLLIGLLLMAMMMYLDGVLGLDTDVAPIASTIGIFLIPLFGGKTNRKEVNIMQTTATAVTFSAYSLTGNYIPMLMLGAEYRLLPAIIVLLLSNGIGICFVSLLRNQFVYDESLPFPSAVMCKTAIDQVDDVKSTSAKILLIATVLSMIISFLQNLEFAPCLIDFSSVLPSTIPLSILVLPMMIGMGYVIGTKICMFMVVISLLVCFVEAPLGFRYGLFDNPVENYEGLQNFNLSLVIGMSLFAALVPLFKQRKSFSAAFKISGGTASAEGESVPLKTLIVLVLIQEVALIAVCAIFYQVSIIPMIICNVLSLIFATIAVRVFAESGLSAGLALNLFMLLIAFALTKNPMFALLAAFTNFNTFVLAQDTMVDLKVGAQIYSSPVKQIKAQYIGIFVGSIVGAFLFYGILLTFGLDSDFFVYPFGKMYYAVVDGLSTGGMSGAFNLPRFLVGSGVGTALSLVGLPAGAIALSMYLAPKTIIGLALGGIVRFIVQKAKGETVADKLKTAATGMVVGDAMACLIMVIVTMFIF